MPLQMHARSKAVTLGRFASRPLAPLPAAAAPSRCLAACAAPASTSSAPASAPASASPRQQPRSAPLANPGVNVALLARRGPAGPAVRRGLRPAAAAAVTDVEAPQPSSSGAEFRSAPSARFEFACPICLETRFQLDSVPTQPGAGLSCSRCARTFSTAPDFLDLTLTSGARQKVYNQRAWGGTELFRNPLVSFVYERGWRQGFAWAGFPGVDKEYDLAMSYLLPAAQGKVLVDMSCGSGLFSRRFARSGSFSGVIAADFSESMLQQTAAYCAEEGGSSTPLMLLRADVGRLPFPTGSVAAIHAGAAIHCWPNPQLALAEISRVLAPGGVFVASTFLTATAPLGSVLGDDLVRPLGALDPTSAAKGGPLAAPYRWWEEAELRDLCEGVGLGGFTRTREWRFIMFSATKPGGGAAEAEEAY